jgi:hypothetical protein
MPAATIERAVYRDGSTSCASCARHRADLGLALQAVLVLDGFRKGAVKSWEDILATIATGKPAFVTHVSGRRLRITLDGVDVPSPAASPLELGLERLGVALAGGVVAAAAAAAATAQKVALVDVPETETIEDVDVNRNAQGAIATATKRSVTKMKSGS